jgi:Domain of Unknown Function (DUF748)
LIEKHGDSPGTPIDYFHKYRRYVWTLVALAIYAALGFFLAPWLLEKKVVYSIRESYGAELRLEKVEINPFVLSLRLSGIELDDPVGAPVARVEKLLVNFQLSSLFRWAWTFDEIRVTAPELFVARDELGNLNLAFLFAETAEQTAVAAEEQEPVIIPVLVFDFVIENCAINWHDEVPVDTVATRFEPINIEIEELNTLPNRSGQQTVLITTESAGTLSWTGSLQLNPLKSAAHASINGSHFPLATAYIHHQTGFDIVQGNADVELDYTIETMSDGTISAAVDNFNLAFKDVVVHTFSGTVAADATSQDREVLRLPEIRLTEGKLRWPDKTVSFAALTMDDTLVNLYRDESGTLNIDRSANIRVADGEVTDENDDSTSTENEWQISLQNFSINHLELNLADHSVSPFADVGIADFNLSVSDINAEPGSRFQTSLALQVRTGGTLTMEGAVSILPEAELDLDLVIDNVALAGAHPYIKALADVHMDSGALNLNGRIHRSGEEPFSFAGDLDIVDFEITETDEGSRLGSWQKMDAKNVALSIAKQELRISEILLEKLYGDVVIAEDGGLNLGRVEKTGSGAISDNTDAVKEAEPETQTEDRSAGPQLATTVGRVVLSEAAADFADFSLPLPFSVNIEDLNGNMTTISTTSSEPSAVSLEGKVDDYGFVRVTGSVTPLDPSINTDLTVSFQNIFVPKFTSYTIPFAGREIASGDLDLSLGYQVTDSQLIGENSIILRDLELGEKVPHPDAMSLPLGLAVALLKDSEGKIDIDLPVRGDLNDPEFSYGGVVINALGNLIIKIVASPFALLGKLIGVEASELEYVSFIDGRADLTPPELERAAKIAEALALRPELVLEISGVSDADADGLALRTEQLDAMLEEGIATLDSAGIDEDMYAEQRTEVLESLFAGARVAENVSLALQELRVQFTSQATLENGEAPVPEFDELAYTNEIRRQLVNVQLLPETALAELALLRAENTKIAILENNDDLQNRINIVAARSITRKPDQMIKIKVNLSAGELE